MRRKWIRYWTAAFCLLAPLFLARGGVQKTGPDFVLFFTGGLEGRVQPCG
jgi:hypothetical protein